MVLDQKMSERAYSVGSTRVRHGVPSVSVGHVFVDERALASTAPLLSVLHSSLDSQDVHTVNLETRNVLSTLVVVRECRSTVCSGTHTVLVVYPALVIEGHFCGSSGRTLAAEDDRNVPELSHVEGLKDLSLVASTVTVKRKCHVVLTHVLVGESDSSADGNLCADDTITSVETSGEHVHRSTLAVCDTLSSSKQFTDDGPDCSSAHHGEAVAAVGGNDVVLLGDSMFDTDSDGLLSSRKMAETPNLLLLVESVRGHFHSPGS